MFYSSMEFYLFVHLINMTRILAGQFLLSFALVFSCGIADTDNAVYEHCECDTTKAKASVLSKQFNRISQFDTAGFDAARFYELDASINRTLWYRDVENVDTTKFTRLWNDYAPCNYHASQLDFLGFYERKKDIELAFQFGPNMDLWAYHIFIFKKIGCCFLVTRSYFRHARFTYKAYAIIDSKRLDSLYTILYAITSRPVGDKEEFSYRGYFVDNRNKKKFFIDFEAETEKVNGADTERKPKKAIKDLYEFVDNRIYWTKTYSL